MKFEKIKSEQKKNDMTKNLKYTIESNQKLNLVKTFIF